MLYKYCKKLLVIIIFTIPVSFYSQTPDSTAVNKTIRESIALESAPKEAVKLAEKAYSESQLIGYKEGEAEALFLMGKYRYKLLEYDKASENLIKAQSAFEGLRDNKKIARNYMHLGELYRAIAEYELSIPYLQKALKIYDSEKDIQGTSKTCDRLAAVYYEISPGNTVYLDSAMKYLERSLPAARTINDIETISSSLNILGAAYIEKKEYDQGITHLIRALEFSLKNNLQNDVFLIKENLAVAYYYKKDYSKAIEHSKQAFDYAEKNKIYPFIDMSTLNLFLSYEKLGDYKNAFKYLRIYNENRWVLYDEKKARQIRTLESKYRAEKKEVIVENQKKVMLLEVGVFSLLLLAAIFVIWFYRSRNMIMKRKNAELEKKNSVISDQNEKLIELNTTKDKLFSIIGHDLKNPYQSLKEFSNILIQDYKELSEAEIKEFLGYIREASDSGNRLLQNLLDWSRSETGNIKYEPEMFYLHEIIEEAVSLTSNNAIHKDITIEAKVSNSQEVFCDRNMIYTVLRNLLSNAIKFSHRGSKINICSVPRGSMVEVAITDSGIGMNEATINDLFILGKVASKDGTESEKGTGLGLFLCKEFVEKNKGTIHVESTPGKGSTFSFTLPASVIKN